MKMIASPIIAKMVEHASTNWEDTLVSAQAVLLGPIVKQA